MSPEVAQPATLSVVVISKDDPIGLAGTLRSLESQRTHPTEVILVTKGTSDEVSTEEFDLHSVRRLEQKDKGISAAFNLALAAARCDWVCFLNGGDRFADVDVLTRSLATLGPEADIVAARARDRLNGNLIPRDHYFHGRRVELISHQASFFRRVLFERHGDYSPDFRIRMDFEWMLRVLRDARVAWVDDVIVDFEGGGASSVAPWQSCREELRALRLHHAPRMASVRLLLLYLPYRVVRSWVRSAKTT